MTYVFMIIHVYMLQHACAQGNVFWRSQNLPLLTTTTAADAGWSRMTLACACSDRCVKSQSCLFFQPPQMLAWSRMTLACAAVPGLASSPWSTGATSASATAGNSSASLS
eukprot:1159203-Pelagomonas_calceolata.AAC.6